MNNVGEENSVQDGFKAGRNRDWGIEEKKSRTSIIIVAVAGILFAGIVAGAASGLVRRFKTETPQSGKRTENTVTGRFFGNKEGSENVPFLEFCSDPELSEWFDSIEKEPPVKLEYTIYGMAPYSMEFTDQEQIMDAARALLTVTIGEMADFATYFESTTHSHFSWYSVTRS